MPEEPSVQQHVQNDSPPFSWIGEDLRFHSSGSARDKSKQGANNLFFKVIFENKNRRFFGRSKISNTAVKMDIKYGI